MNPFRAVLFIALGYLASQGLIRVAEQLTN